MSNATEQVCEQLFTRSEMAIYKAFYGHSSELPTYCWELAGLLARENIDKQKRNLEIFNRIKIVPEWYFVLPEQERKFAIECLNAEKSELSVEAYRMCCDIAVKVGKQVQARLSARWIYNKEKLCWVKLVKGELKFIRVTDDGNFELFVKKDGKDSALYCSVGFEGVKLFAETGVTV